MILDYTQWYDWLQSKNFSTLIYSGEWDTMTGGPGAAESWLRQCRYLTSDIWEDARRIYLVNYTITNKSYVGGYWRADPLNLITLLTLPKTGNAAFRNNVPTLKQAIGDFLSNQALQCHSDDPTQCLTASKMCAAMNDCSGHGECQINGQCICTKGYTGADCGQKAQMLTSFVNKVYQVNGTQNVIFEYREGLYPGERFDMTISAQQPLDIFVNPVAYQDFYSIKAYSIEPSEFDYVASFKRQSYIKLTSEQFPRLTQFAAKVRVSGSQYYDNKYLQSSFRVQFTVYDKDGMPKASSLSSEEDLE